MYEKMFTYENYDEVGFMRIQFCNCVLKIPMANYKKGDKFDFICIDYPDSSITFYTDRNFYKYNFDLNVCVKIDNFGTY